MGHLSDCRCSRCYFRRRRWGRLRGSWRGRAGLLLRKRRRRSCLGFDAAKFAGSEVGDDDDLAADERLRSVGLGDSGDDLADFDADVDGEAQEFVGLLNLFGGEDGADAEVDLDEIVDGDVGVGGLRRRLASCSGGARRCLRWPRWRWLRGCGVRRLGWRLAGGSGARRRSYVLLPSVASFQSRSCRRVGKRLRSGRGGCLRSTVPSARC